LPKLKLNMGESSSSFTDTSDSLTLVEDAAERDQEQQRGQGVRLDDPFYSNRLTTSYHPPSGSFDRDSTSDDQPWRMEHSPTELVPRRPRGHSAISYGADPFNMGSMACPLEMQRSNLFYEIQQQNLQYSSETTNSQVWRDVASSSTFHGQSDLNLKVDECGDHDVQRQDQDLIRDL
jgi:hypothetical protein